MGARDVETPRLIVESSSVVGQIFLFSLHLFRFIGRSGALLLQNHVTPILPIGGIKRLRIVPVLLEHRTPARYKLNLYNLAGRVQSVESFLRQSGHTVMDSKGRIIRISALGALSAILLRNPGIS